MMSVNAFSQAQITTRKEKLSDFATRTMKVVLPEERLCGIVRNIGREGQSSRILTLGELQAADVDMFCTVFVGNSSTKVVNGALITPRGYRNV